MIILQMVVVGYRYLLYVYVYTYYKQDIYYYPEWDMFL